jgi:hypothetical protein
MLMCSNDVKDSSLLQTSHPLLADGVEEAPISPVNNEVIELKKINRKQDILLRSLERYYYNPEIHNKFRTIVSGGGPVSLRLMEWFVTNYAKRENIVYHRENMQCFNVYLNYKSQLKAYNKRYFDPFCRHERSIIYDNDGNMIETTVGQANFFRWVFDNGVLDYAIEHSASIEADMSCSSKERNSSVSTDGSSVGRRKRRGEINKSATRLMNRTEGEFVISFR